MFFPWLRVLGAFLAIIKYQSFGCASTLLFLDVFLCVCTMDIKFDYFHSAGVRRFVKTCGGMRV